MNDQAEILSQKGKFIAPGDRELVAKGTRDDGPQCGLHCYGRSFSKLQELRCHLVQSVSYEPSVALQTAGQALPKHLQ